MPLSAPSQRSLMTSRDNRRLELSIPREWAGQPVELELWLGGEGFVCLSTGVEGGLDPFHRSFRVTDAARGGEPLRIQADAVPKSMFGSQIPKPRLLRASLVVPETEVRV